jgi:hypothetical protein
VKRFFLTLLILLFTSVALGADLDTFEATAINDSSTIEGKAGLSAIEGQTIESVTLFCADGCTGEADADIKCEDNEGSETIANDGSDARCSGWTAVESGGGTVTQAAHSGTFSCSDKGDKALNTAGWNENAYISQGFTDVNDFYNIFYINFATDNITTGGSDKTLGFYKALDDGSTEFSLSFLKDDTDQSLGFQLQYEQSGTKWAQNDYGITANTWYQIEISYVATNLTVLINGNSLFNKTVDNAQVDVVQYGMNNLGDAGGNNVIQIDNMKEDDDTLPGACAGWSP